MEGLLCVSSISVVIQAHINFPNQVLREMPSLGSVAFFGVVNRLVQLGRAHAVPRCAGWWMEWVRVYIWACRALVSRSAVQQRAMTSPARNLERASSARVADSFNPVHWE